MGEFTAGWLALREPADARARSAKLTGLVADRLGHHAPLLVLDLGAGTGANARYLARFLAAGVQWLLVDHDGALLDQAHLPETRHLDRLQTQAVDLATAVEPAADDIFAGRDLITASALLDLVSEPWLDALARQCRVARAPVLFALTYNGDIRCSPEEPEDGVVRDLVNQHQRTDKGFGAALGPDACASAARAFAALGYEVRRERSDWLLGEESDELQTQLIGGWAGAAGKIAPGRVASLDDWKARRLAHVSAGRSHLVVGHEDLAAWL